MEIRGERKQCGQICVLLGLLLSCYSIRQSSALSLTVDDVECVFEYVLHDGDTISGNFVVDESDIFWTSDYPGIDFTESDWNQELDWNRNYSYLSFGLGGNIVHSLKGSSGDKFELKAPRSGMYRFCFHNPSSAANTVSFHIHVGHILTEHDLAKDEHLDPINVKIAQLREALESVTGEQKYLKARDARHHHTNESTRKRLVVYTVLEYMLLVVSSGVQLLIIHRLFGKSVGYNRV